MAALKLHYFDLNGLAESVRYILHYGGLKFEDIRYPRASWPDQRVKDNLPFGQLPLFEKGNRSIHQSLAIARYVASQVKLLPAEPWEQAVLDSIVFTIYDFWAKILPYIVEKDSAKKAELKKQILEEYHDFYFSRFEQTLKKNGGFFNGRLSWADFVLVGIIEAGNLFLDYELEKAYPTIRQLVTKIRALPGVKEYIATRKPYTV